MQEIVRQLATIAQGVKEINGERLISIESKLELLTALNSEISDCISQVPNLQRTTAEFEMKVGDLENRSSRSNLIVYGMEEDADSGEDSLDQIINNPIINGMLKMFPIPIARAHRLGKPYSD